MKDIIADVYYILASAYLLWNWNRQLQGKDRDSKPRKRGRR